MTYIHFVIMTDYYLFLRDLFVINDLSYVCKDFLIYVFIGDSRFYSHDRPIIMLS